MSSFVLHVDLDEFIAAVEVQRHPELAGKPVVVGGDGDPAKRGVVSTASYEARRFGIRSGMPLRTAAKRCPEAVFLPVDEARYGEVSDDVMGLLRRFPAIVEVAGWDEAYLAVKTDEPEAMGAEVQRVVREGTGLWCSVGVGDNKLRSKIASGFAKPRGVFTLTRANWNEIMGGLPVDALWGIGSKTARKLAELGVRTVEQLAATDEGILAGRFGPNIGPWLRRLATGEDRSMVTGRPREPRGKGRERTFQQDLTDPAEVHGELNRLARELERELASDGPRIARVVVKVRFAPFDTITRGMRVQPPADWKGREAIENFAARCLEQFDLRRPVRLLGVRVEFERSE
jgi:DNA polymerase-4